MRGRVAHESLRSFVSPWDGASGGGGGGASTPSGPPSERARARGGDDGVDDGVMRDGDRGADAAAASGPLVEQRSRTATKKSSNSCESWGSGATRDASSRARLSEAGPLARCSNLPS